MGHSFYCTPEAMIPGCMTVTSACIQFEPDPRDQHVRDQGIGQYQVYIDTADLLECGAVSMPSTDNDSHPVPFIQLHLRTLNGRRPPVESKEGMPVVFRMNERDDL